MHVSKDIWEQATAQVFLGNVYICSPEVEEEFD